MQRAIYRFAQQILICIIAVSCMSCAMIKRNVAAVSDGIKKYGDPEGQAANDEGSEKPRAIIPDQNNMVMDASKLYDEEEILWADTDPDKPMPGLDEIWAVEDDSDNWQASYSEVMRLSETSGKPVLIWFDQSNRNPSSSALHRELFSKKDFEKWAEENVIRLRVDKSIQRVSSSDKKKYERMLKQRDYVKKLREQYKILGSPVVVMLSARGTQIGKYRGYKSGSSSFLFGQLKSAYTSAISDYANWREEYEKRGYRIWHDNRGRKVFAKPVGLKSGEITLKNTEGKRSKTKLTKLSKNDQDWVASYIKKRRK